MHVLNVIHDTAAASPDKLALVHDGQPISYGRFWRLIDGCRRELSAHSLRPGLVVVQVKHLVDGWVLDLALRSLGYTVAVAHPSFHPPELFAGRDVSALITVPAEAVTPMALASSVWRVTTPSPAGLVLADDSPLPPWAIEGPFGGHIMLTSGTTGLPKLVPSRAGETEEAFAATRQTNRGLDERFQSQGADGVFCMFDLELWTGPGYTLPILAWTQRAAVVFDQRYEPYLALQWPGITRATVTPLYVKRILSAPEGAFPYQPYLRLILWAGAISRQTLAEARRRITPTILNNVASTEVGLWASTPLDCDDDLVWQRPVPSQRIEVVDEAGRPLPPGRLGQVRIALAKPGGASHLGDAATTAAQYQDGWFYPGDLGVFDGRGRISLRGRANDVVSFDGLKLVVEPWERKLRDALGVDEVCILSGHFGAAEDAMHVFIETTRTITLEELTRVLQDTLAGFPHVKAHKVASLPRTPSGKVRRIELAQQLDDAAATEAAAAAS